MEITNETLPGVMMTVSGVCVSVIAGVLFVAFGPPVDVANHPERISPPIVFLVGVIISIGGIVFVNHYSSPPENVESVKRNGENSPPPPYSDRHLRQSIVGEMLTHSPYTQIRLHSDKFLQVQNNHIAVLPEQNEDGADAEEQPTEHTECLETTIIIEDCNRKGTEVAVPMLDAEAIERAEENRHRLFEPDGLKDNGVEAKSESNGVHLTQIECVSEQLNH